MRRQLRQTCRSRRGVHCRRRWRHGGVFTGPQATRYWITTSRPERILRVIRDQAPLPVYFRSSFSISCRFGWNAEVRPYRSLIPQRKKNRTINRRCSWWKTTFFVGFYVGKCFYWVLPETKPSAVRCVRSCDVAASITFCSQRSKLKRCCCRNGPPDVAEGRRMATTAEIYIPRGLIVVGVLLISRRTELTL